MSLVATLTAKPIAANDIGAVEGVMQDFVTLSKSLENFAIVDQSGSVIAVIPENPADKTGHISQFRSEFRCDGGDGWQIVTQWSTAPLRAGADAHIAEAMLFKSALLVAELMLSTVLNSVQRAYTENIAKSGAAMMPIINDILDFFKNGSRKTLSQFSTVRPASDDREPRHDDIRRSLSKRVGNQLPL